MVYGGSERVVVPRADALRVGHARGSGFRVSGFGFGGSGSGYQFRVLGFGFRVRGSGFEFRVGDARTPNGGATSRKCSAFRVSNFGSRLQGSGRVQGEMIEESYTNRDIILIELMTSGRQLQASREGSK
jgi:hypothetical protein